MSMVGIGMMTPLFVIVLVAEEVVKQVLITSGRGRPAGGEAGIYGTPGGT